MASFQKDVNYQAGLAKKFVATVTDPNVELPYDVNINTDTYGKRYAGGMYVTKAGNLDVVMAQDDTNTKITFTGVLIGTFLPIQIKKVFSTSTAEVIGLF